MSPHYAALVLKLRGTPGPISNDEIWQALRLITGEIEKIKREYEKEIALIKRDLP